MNSTDYETGDCICLRDAQQVIGNLLTQQSISSDDVGLLLFNVVINNCGIESMLLKCKVRSHAQKCYKPLRGHD